MNIPPLEVNDRIRFTVPESEARFWWTVRAGDARYTILTRQAPFLPKGRLVYTIIDRERGLRGPCNAIGQGYAVEVPGGCDDLLEDLQAGLRKVSYRNNIRVQIREEA